MQHWFGGQWSLWPVVGIVVALAIDLAPAGGYRRRRPSVSNVLHRVLLIGAALSGCGSPPRTDAGLVAEHIRTRIEAAGVVTDLRAAGEPVYASEVLPKFYERRLYSPAWSDEHGATRLADDFLTALRRADVEGLRAEDYHLAGIEAVLAAVRAEDAKGRPALAPDRWAELDLLLTDAFLVYGAHLLAGRVNPETLTPEWVSNRRTADIAAVLETALASGNIAGSIEALVPSQYGYRRLREALARYRLVAAGGGWPTIPDGATLQRGDSGLAVAALRQRLRLENDLVGETDDQDGNRFDARLEQALDKFQRRHGLTEDGVVSAATRAELNVPVDRRVEQLELNLERWRWLPKDLGRRHIIVNIAAFELEVVDAEAVVLAMRVVVGRPFNRTPVLSDTMRYLVLNPYWHVPRNIAAAELLPKLERDRSYLRRLKMRVFPSSGPDAREIDPATVNWPAITPAHFPFWLRQDPGPLNALGRVKFMFLNKFNVYLHDTPAGPLFEESQRDFSHGCIRIEQPIELAVYLLRPNPRWTRDSVLSALGDAVDRTVPRSPAGADADPLALLDRLGGWGWDDRVPPGYPRTGRPALEGLTDTPADPVDHGQVKIVEGAAPARATSRGSRQKSRARLAVSRTSQRA